MVESIAPWEGEAPREYVVSILQKLFPDSEIVDYRDQHLSGRDWRIDDKYWVDDTNDRWLGYTGNISLDESKLHEKDIYQLFINTALPNRYMFIDNKKLDVAHIEKTGRKHTEKQKWGGFTSTYITPISEVESAIVKADPSIVWFKTKRWRKL